MRDINRIDPLLAKLGEAWKKVPDQRFGQFMVNFFNRYGKDPFFPEDDVWMVGLQAFIDGKDVEDAMEAYSESQTNETPKSFSELMEGVKHSLRRSAEELKEEFMEELNDLLHDDD